MTFEDLTTIISTCIRGLINASLTLKQCICLMKCSGLNEEMITRVKEFANSENVDDDFENDDIISIIDSIVPPQWKTQIWISK